MRDPRITVLHVDDDERFAELIRTFFDRHHDDITIRTAYDGDEALAVLERTDDLDCVVSDYEMPGLNGLELLEAVREHWPDLPFILFTGKGSEEIAVKAINAGVTDYLQKQSDTSPYTVLANRVRNVVAQHRAQRDLERLSRRAETQFELLIDAIEDYAIFLLDEEGYIRTWNAGAERIKGYTSEEVLGEHVSIFYRDEDVETGVPEWNLHRAAAEGQIRDEGWRVRNDGSEFWAHVTITALYEGDDLVGYAKVTRDDTQRHREQLLLEQNEQLEDLIAAISHDLRNPLTVAEGNVELAIETGDVSRLGETREAHERAVELLDYLGSLAREDGRITDPEPVDLRKVVQDAWRSVETAEANLVVEGDKTLVADRLRLQQLLENLFWNSVEHGSTGSRAEPDDSVEHGSTGGRTQSDDSVEHAGTDLIVTIGPLEGGFFVEDSGPGIPETERERVFEKGYSTDADGSGFGLAICRRIASAHGWSIDVTDGSDGGARFEVTGVEEM